MNKFIKVIEQLTLIVAPIVLFSVLAALIHNNNLNNEACRKSGGAIVRSSEGAVCVEVKL